MTTSGIRSDNERFENLTVMQIITQNLPVFLILLGSLTLQVVAVFMALRLIRLTGKRLAWGLVIAGFMVMAARRIVVLARILSGDADFDPDVVGEIHGLFASALFAVGGARIASIFLERHRAEEELHRRKEEFRALAENSPDYISRHDRHGHFLYCNPALRKLLGLPETDYLGLTVMDPGPHGKGGQAVQRKIQEVFREGRPAEIEIPFDLIPVPAIPTHHVRFTPEFDRFGRVESVLVQGRDITPLKEAQRQVQMLVENLPDPVVRFDTEGRYIFLAPATLRIYNLRSDEEALGKTILELEKPGIDEETNRRLYDDVLRTAREGTPGQMLVELKQPGGRRVFEVRHIPERNESGTVISVLTLTREITAELRSTDLTHENEILQTLMQGAVHSHLAYLDRDFNFVCVNDAFARNCGRTREDLIGMNTFDLFPREENEAIFLRVRESGVPVEFHDHPFVFPGQPGRGVTYWDWTLFPVKDASDAVRALIFDLFETTGRKLADDARLASQQEAERLARVRAEFLSHMSHEIRTPMNGVLGMAQVGLAKSSDENDRESFRAILTSGRILKEIIDDILDFSKIEANKLAIRALPASPRQLMDEVIRLIPENAMSRGVCLRVECNDDVPDCILADPLRVKQILMNLLSNAFKFTSKGFVRALTRRDGDRILFSIEDTGPGLTPDQLERLFQPFEQASASTIRQFGGTGLGLAISSRLAHLMGGEITVRSAPGEGSRFDVYLPLILGDGLPFHERDEASRTAATKRLGGLCILAAEDNEMNRLVLTEMLRMEGARYAVVANGARAVEQIRNSPGSFDIVLMDIQMPGMDGYEATRQILSIRRDLPVVGITGFAMEGDRDQCLAAGMADHVAKPFDLDRLVETILIHAKGG